MNHVELNTTVAADPLDVAVARMCAAHPEIDAAQTALDIARENREAAKAARAWMPRGAGKPSFVRENCTRDTVEYRSQVRCWAKEQLRQLAKGDGFNASDVDLENWLKEIAQSIEWGELPSYMNWSRRVPDIDCQHCLVACEVRIEDKIVGDTAVGEYAVAKCPLCRKEMECEL